MSGLLKEGRLADTPLPELLLALYRQRATGTLRLHRERAEKQVQLLDGAPVSVETNVPSERMAARLGASGAIDAAVAERLDGAIDERSSNEAAALAALRIFEPKQLLRVLREQSRSRLLGCFGWMDGEYEWKEGDADAGRATLRSDPIALVQQGLASHWDPERILMELAPLANQVAAPKESLPSLLRRLDRSGALDALLAGLRGETRFDVLLGRASRDPKALAAAWVLVRCDALEFSEVSDAKPEESDCFTADARIEIAVVDDTRKETHGEREEARRSARREARAGKAEELREEIVERHSTLDGADHYEVLGVPRDAAANVIKKAYLTAAKRFHPDKVGALGLDDVRELSDQLIARLNEAHTVLSDAASRQAYDQAADAGDAPEIDLNRVAQAEAFYLKGEIMMKMGDFRSAAPLMQNAVDVWPDECAYQAGLGWVLFKKSPSEPERAVEHLTLALEHDPNSAEAYHWLSVVLRSMGSTREADDALARARAINPSIG